MHKHFPARLHGSGYCNSTGIMPLSKVYWRTLGGATAQTGRKSPSWLSTNRATSWPPGCGCVAACTTLRSPRPNGAKRSMPETSEDDDKRGEGAEGRGTHSRINADGLRPSETSCCFEHSGHVIGDQGHSEIPPFWRTGRWEFCAASCHLPPSISHPEPQDQQFLAQLRAELGSYSV